MKRVRIAAGMMMWMTATSVYAQTCPESQTLQNLLSIRPVGIYVQKVFDRVDAGIQIANSAPAGEPSFGQQYFTWISKITGAILGLVDTDLRVNEYERNLTQNTACLHTDLILMEAKMEQVRCEIKKATADGKGWGVTQLLAIQNFLNVRYKNLVRGAKDPNFQDKEWQQWQIFDPTEQAWCCADRNPNNTCEYIDVKDCRFKLYGAAFVNVDQCAAYCQKPANPPNNPPAREVACPFDTDYLPATGAGYGCSLDVLNAIAGYPPVDSEKDSLQEFTDDRNQFLTATNIQHIKDAYVRMLEFQGRPIPPELDNFGKTPDAPHLRRYGCFANETPNGPVPSDQKNTWPEGAISLETRGPFAYSKDNIVLLRAFFDLSRRFAALRLIPEYLRYSYEFDAGSTAQQQALEDEFTLFGVGRSMKEFVRGLIESIDRNQAGLESAIFPKAADGELRLIEIMEPVRPVMSRITQNVTNSQSGLRGFVKNYAYFLRRSCIFRSCSDRLDKVIKILLSNECFPYANGTYVGSEDTWKKCQDAINNQK